MSSDSDLDEKLKLLARHAAPTTRVDEEEALFLALPPEKQQVVLQRLKAIDEYTRVAAPGPAAAEAAGKKLGIAGRTFYHMLRRVREVGPVRALAPGFRVKRRASVATEGLGAVAEEAMLSFLREMPEARLGQVYRAVCAATAEKGIDPPSEADFRRRLHEVRRAGVKALGPEAAFGRSLLIDQSTVNLALRFLGRKQRAVVTLIVDRDTRVICGAALTAGGSGDLGLRSAIFDATERRLPELANEAIALASSLEEIEWVVPPGLEGQGKWWSEAAKRISPQLMVRAVDLRPKRHGVALLRLLGDKLGPFTLKVRVPITPEIVTDDSVPDYDPDVGLRLIFHAVDTWNQPILTVFAGNSDASAMKERKEALRALSALLRSLFEPVIDGGGSPVRHE